MGATCWQDCVWPHKRFYAARFDCSPTIVQTWLTLQDAFSARHWRKTLGEDAAAVDIF